MKVNEVKAAQEVLSIGNYLYKLYIKMGTPSLTYSTCDAVLFCTVIATYSQNLAYDPMFCRITPLGPYQGV